MNGLLRRCAVLLLVLFSPAAGSADDDLAERFADRRAFDRFVEQGRSSPFGLDYVFVHSPGARDRELVESFCSAVAVRWVNLTRLEWSRVEKGPPRRGKHTYDWSDLDRAVAAWQRNGVHVMVSLRFASPWATAERNDKEFVYLKGPTRLVALKGADYLPRPEHMDDLRAYARALVERYDGDGRDDMPGLLFPVLHYQVGNEYYNELFWTGTAKEYGRLLETFARGARKACPDVKVILTGIGFREIYGFYDIGMRPRTEAYVKEHLPKVPDDMREFMRRADRFSKTTLAFHRHFDILDARWSNYGTVAMWKKELARAGARGMPVWSAEIYSGFPLMEPLVLPNWTLQAWPTPSRSREYLRVLRKTKHPQFDRINAWYRRMQAAHVVKLCMVGLDAGSEKLMMGWAFDAQHPLAVSTLSHHGLYSITFEKLWPAAHTYNLLIRKLDGLQGVRRLDMPDDVYVYECTCRGGRRVLVAFVDDHVGQNHDQKLWRTKAVIPFRAPSAEVTDIITEIDRTEATTRRVETDGGRLRLELTELPVIIEPTRGR